ncbi:MAG: RIP metalloprotease RseP [Elusimicrobia bacterium]|jgi:regulator of sigma E protease|nr:RIP metalloprotease RseP [Elusimicrobiota bacterium]
MISSALMSTLAVVFTFSVVVFVHELGHFLVALKTGILVETFSLGFGPEIIGFTRSGIRYKLSAIPLGGYVKMKGEDPDAEGAEDRDSFMGQTPFKRIGVLVAGPLMNFFTGIVIFASIIYLAGMPVITDKPVIGEIMPASPAAAAGIEPGDRIVAVNGEKPGTWTELAELIDAQGAEGEIYFKISRAGKITDIAVAPLYDEDAGRHLIGITALIQMKKAGLLKSITEGAKYTGYICARLVSALYLMITGRMEAAISGPIGIAKIVSQTAAKGMTQFFQLLAFISVNLGFLNLLPIPILDGGHVLIALIEKAKGSPVDPRKVNIANIVGFSLLITLMLFATYKDIVRLFF